MEESDVTRAASPVVASVQQSLNGDADLLPSSIRPSSQPASAVLLSPDLSGAVRSSVSECGGRPGSSATSDQPSSRPYQETQTDSAQNYHIVLRETATRKREREKLDATIRARDLTILSKDNEIRKRDGIIAEQNQEIQEIKRLRLDTQHEAQRVMQENQSLRQENEHLKQEKQRLSRENQHLKGENQQLMRERGHSLSLGSNKEPSQVNVEPQEVEPLEAVDDPISDVTKALRR